MPSIGAMRAGRHSFRAAVAGGARLARGIPLMVLPMFWFAARQNRDDERFRGDD